VNLVCRYYMFSEMLLLERGKQIQGIHSFLYLEFGLSQTIVSQLSDNQKLKKRG